MNCKNCNTSLTLESDFCNCCGAKVIRNRLTIKNLFEHLIETYLNYDNKFLQTFIGLIKCPENVIGSYVDGVRKKYINPLSFLAISLTLSGIYLFFFQDTLGEALNSFISESSQLQGQEKLNEAIFNLTFDYNSLLYFIIIPALALISWVVFYNKKYTLTEHVVIYLYSMSFSSIASIIMTLFILYISPLNYMFLSSFIYLVLFVYHLFLLKRLFQLNFKQIVVKTLLFIPLFFVFYLISSIAMLVFVLLTGDVSISDLVPKK